MARKHEPEREAELTAPVEIPVRTYEQSSDKLRETIGTMRAGMQSHEAQDFQYALCRLLDDCDTEARILKAKITELE